MWEVSPDVEVITVVNYLNLLPGTIPVNLLNSEFVFDLFKYPTKQVNGVNEFLTGWSLEAPPIVNNTALWKKADD